MNLPTTVFSSGRVPHVRFGEGHPFRTKELLLLARNLPAGTLALRSTYKDSVMTTEADRSSRRAVLEFCVGYGLILAAIWTLNPWQRWFYWIAITWIVVTTWIGRPTWKALGLGLPGLVRSLWVVGVAAILAGLAVYTASRLHSLHRLHGPTPLISHVWGYLVWAVMQQFLLQIYFLLRLMRLLPGKVAPVVAAAGLFSLAHLPNPVLTPVTLVWGVAACILFLRYRNIYTLGLAHGILGLCVAVIVPDSIQHHMRVGIGYYRYHPHRNQIPQIVSTDAWVMADAPTLRS
jgi:hypothetical protein